ncbi:MAG: alkaline phosphatase D family protein [Gammaproteobacteria bacterium]|nr:alkaline phosphatase D family protein [Gammaproteobacteria bacterium]
MKRRQFLKYSIAATGAVAIPNFLVACAHKRPAIKGLTAVEPFVSDTKRHWLGKSYWGNRLQDWYVNNGRLECLNGQKSWEVRTVSVLTRRLSTQKGSARVRVKLGQLEPNKQSFAGFLLGVGQGELDQKGCSIVQRCSGTGGGIMATINSNGQLAFKDFSSNTDTLNYKTLESASPNSQFKPNDAYYLDCQIEPNGAFHYDIKLTALNEQNKEVAFALLPKVDASVLVGGISLLSSPPVGKSGGRWWFSDLETAGDKIEHTNQFELGPVVGCMYSLNQSVLKLTTQLMPVDLTKHNKVRLDYKSKSSTTWTKGPTSDIEDGYVGLFRVGNWQYQQTFDYRITFADSDETLYQGIIVKDPGKDKELKIALYSCIIPTSKSLDGTEYTKLHPREKVLDRYTKENILFPHNELISNCDQHDPDLYLFVGDQYYESYPTRHGNHTKDAKLDTLYRWYLWYWAFADSIKNKPSIMLADDHDILQGNLWGNEGIDSHTEKESDGGYKWDKEIVRMVYRCQHGHNPDPYDPTPIRHDIQVTYGNFVYGGIDFALVEDRKFKTPPNYKMDRKNTTGELLGARQEQFLADWKHMNPGLPKICITASVWGSPQTTPNGTPMIDYDSNGYPADGRERAVKLVSDANALVLAGDQHLAMVTHQGLKEFDDGVTFFAGPAAAAFWQRWFEGNNKLSNQYNNNPDTGNFIDSFGNKMRVMAVGNPKLTHAEFESGKAVSWAKFLADRRLKTEGYGLVRVNHQAQQYTLECWEHDANPHTDKQMTGWPVIVPFKG